MELKKPLSLDEQVNRLIQHGVDVEDKEYAQKILSEINYYRFTGYALQFRNPCSPDDYINGTSFEDILHLHQFDTELRCVLKRYLDVIELYARSQIAYGFSMSKCQKPPYDQHYNIANFYNKESHSGIVSSLDREKEHSKDSLFVIHHSEKYCGKMPLWVIVELLSFTNISKLYSAMYYDEQNIIAKNMGTTQPTLKNQLHCLANLRNKVAHAGRIYNVKLNPPIMLGRKFLQRNPEICADTFFAYLLVLLRRLPDKEDKKALATDIDNLVSQYADCIELSLLGFPANWEILILK